MHLIERFVLWYFVPPVAPIGSLPMGGRIAGLKDTFVDYGKLCYFEGAKDGLSFGLLAGLFAAFALYAVVAAIRSNSSLKGFLGAILALL